MHMDIYVAMTMDMDMEIDLDNYYASLCILECVCLLCARPWHRLKLMIHLQFCFLVSI